MGVSARGLAKELGLTHAAINKAVKAGRISRAADGTFDVAQARKELSAKSNALKRRKTAKERDDPAKLRDDPAKLRDVEPESGDKTLAEAQRRREWLRVQKDELDLARKRGEMAPIAEVNAFVAGMIIRAREILSRIAPELKDRLAQTGNPHDCEKLVSDEIRRSLNELAEFTPAVNP